MSNYKVQVSNSVSGVDATFNIKDYVKYTDKLNGIDEANIKLYATTSKYRELFQVGKNNKVKVSRNGVIEFSGYINSKSLLDAGAVSLRCNSNMALLSNNSYDTEDIWQLEPTEDIATDIINDTDFSVGTIENAFSMDFKTKQGNSYLNTLRNLRDKTNQDLYYTDSTNAINLVDHKGSSTSVMVLNDSRDFVNPIFDTLEPKGNKIRVVGSGIGGQKIESEYPSHGYDATSQSTYGVILYTETDPTIISVAEANALADSLVATYSQPVKSYKINVINTSLDLESGDVITLNAPEKDIDSEEVRIVEIERGVIAGKEFLTLTLANIEYSQALKKRNELLGGTSRKVRDSLNFEQNSTNVLTFSEMINANSSAPLRVKGYLSEDDIRDEAGNSTVSNFLFDYDVDPFRSSVGNATVSESNISPIISGITGDEDTVVGVSGATLSFTPGSSAWYISLLGGLTLPTYDSDHYLIVDIRVIADEDIPSTATGYTEFFLINSTTGAQQGQTSSYKSGYALADGEYLLNQAYTLNNWDAGAVEYGIGTDVYGYDLDIYVQIYKVYRDHAHSSLSGSAASHNHSTDVSIGDDVSDSGSTNASGVTLYLDYWNGTSWVQKHSITTSSVTINQDVDISNGGVYPDAAGYWQVRAYTNNSNSDLVQGVLRVKHGVK